jgi:hypothetical protein
LGGVRFENCGRFSNSVTFRDFPTSLQGNSGMQKRENENKIKHGSENAESS